MLNDFKLNKSSRLPYYYQVYDYLLSKIKEGVIKEGYQLPSELLLCDMFDVSRTTIREALRELEANEYIRRGRGQGTFISKASVESSALQRVSSIVDELKEKGVKTETKILEQKIIDPGNAVREILSLEKKIRVLYINRLMLSDNEPIYITKAFFPNDIFLKIDKKHLVDLSFTKLVEDYFNLEIIHKKRILQPDIPDSQTAKTLQITKNDKNVVTFLQTFWTVNYKNRERIIYFEEYFKSSKSRFIFES